MKEYEEKYTSPPARQNRSLPGTYELGMKHSSTEWLQGLQHQLEDLFGWSSFRLLSNG